MNAITLYELNSRVKQTLKSGFADPVWITAEITEIQLNHSGHCYLQLADKKEEDDSLTATARGTIWAFVFRTLRPYFESVAGRALAKGMKVMLNVEVVFHEVYGYSLNIKDIDPVYTVGDLERKKREILSQLEQDGIINMNRELKFPLLPKNVAVISSPTAAGYGDFVHQLETNPYGYHFQIKLFSASMQGEKTTESVIAALEEIYKEEQDFDVVVIIRGGGSQTDLSCFDSYDMAANIAQFPLPVIAGIGHERDETIVDRVAYLRVKTPTAAATFLIDIFRKQEERLEALERNFLTDVQDLLQEQKDRQLTAISVFKHSVQTLLTGDTTRLRLISQRMEYVSKSYVNSRQNLFDNLKVKISNRVSNLWGGQFSRVETNRVRLHQIVLQTLSDHRQALEIAKTTVKYADPAKVLERGYSITRLNGKAVKDATELRVGDRLETEMAKGRIWSEVTK